MLRRNGPVVKSVESVLRLEGSLWGKDLWKSSETYSRIRQNVARRLSEVHGDLSSLSLIISVFSFPLNLEGLGSAKSSPSADSGGARLSNVFGVLLILKTSLLCILAT